MPKKVVPTGIGDKELYYILLFVVHCIPTKQSESGKNTQKHLFNRVIAWSWIEPAIP